VMTEEIYFMIVSIVEFLICGMVFVFGFVLLNQDLKAKAKATYGQLRDDYAEKAKDDPEKLTAYHAMERKMLSKGISYRLGSAATPFDYMMIRLVVCIGLGIVGMMIGGILLLPIGMLLGFILVPFLFNNENRNDNEEMLVDIGQIYGIVSLQLKNGIYISNVIYECHLSVENPRLKKALLELSIDIDKFGTVGEAAERFRSKFENKYIETFAKTLEQSDLTGQSIQLFEDLLKNIEHINEAISIRTEKKVENKGMLFTMLIFLAIIIFVMYITVSGVAGALGSMF